MLDHLADRSPVRVRGRAPDLDLPIHRVAAQAAAHSTPPRPHRLARLHRLLRDLKLAPEGVGKHTPRLIRTCPYRI